MKNLLILIMVLVLLLSGCSSVSNEEIGQRDSTSETSAPEPPEGSHNPDPSQTPQDEDIGRDEDGMPVPNIPEDGSDLWEKEKWSYMGPNSEIIGIIKAADIRDNTLISLDIEVEANLTDTGSITEGEVIKILYYDPLPESFTPVKEERIMTMLNHYVTGAGREIEWAGEMKNVWFEQEGKLYFANGELYKRDGYEEGLSFEQYAQELGKTLK